MPSKTVLLMLAMFSFAAPLCAASQRPNIVMIIADDQAYTDFGFMGHEHVKTPHIDRLAAQSARYINGYVPSSVCRPSLVTLLTGLYPHQHGVCFNHPPPGNSKLNRAASSEEYDALRNRATYLIRAVDSLPRTLAAHGYRCFQTGKYWEGHYSSAGFTQGMTLARASAEPSYGNRKLPDGSLVAHGNGDAGLNIGRTGMQPLWDFIDRYGQQPFFIWYAPFMPHLPHDSPDKYRQPYADHPDVPEHFHAYYAACTQFDETVGQLVDYLEEKKLARRTIFVFVSDNGWEPAPQRDKKDPRQFVVNQRSKRSPFELGTRTPILLRWDGHILPATLEGLSSSIDIAPTLLTAVGLEEQAKGLPGVNLLPSAMGQETGQSWLKDRAIFGEIYPGDSTALGYPSRDISYRWIRQGRYKLIVPHRQRGEIWRRYVQRPALFDILADPREEHDLAGDDCHAQRVAQLRKHLDQWWTPGDDSAVAKPPPLESNEDNNR